MSTARYCLNGDVDEGAVANSVTEYAPGYRLKQEVQFATMPPDERVHTPAAARCARSHHQSPCLAEGRGSGPWPARLRGQPRHHDLLPPSVTASGVLG